MAEEAGLTAAPDPRLLALRDRIAALLPGADVGDQTALSEGSLLDQLEAGLDRIAAELTAQRATLSDADERIAELAMMMGSMVAFDFSPRVTLSGTGDVYDGFASSLNMMAEELGATTVSSEFIDN